jgi:hypothetical protein
MTNPRFRCLVVLILAVAIATHLAAQVQTEVPSLVPGAKAVTVEHIKIHGTALEGNLEGNAITTGDFEQFVAHDVVAYIDSHYRKIPHRASRGLVGHSMGGYGATRIGMQKGRRVRQSLHHESVLLVATSCWSTEP